MRRALLILLLATAACQKPAEPANAPVALELPAATPEPTQDSIARDDVATERSSIPEIAGLTVADGRWTLDQDGQARFGLGGEPDFTIGCDKGAGMIVLTRRALSGTNIQILADRGANRFDAQDGGDRTIARFSARFPWFTDVLARAEGAFGVRVEDGEPLVLPADPLIGQVIAACRRSVTGAAR